MIAMCSPKARRNLSRLLPFPVIWVLTGWVFMLVEFAASGDSNPNSQFACSFDPPIYGNVIIPFRINESEVTGMEFSVDENVEPHSYFFDKVE